MNNKIKVILLSLAVLSVVGTANAAATSLSVFPTSLTKDAGSTFQISVVANTPGTKICAVEGKLAFDNLACQSIAVSNDVLAQTSPTCTNPYFLIGIPSCTISDKTVFSVTVKAANIAGIATVNLTGVEIIDDYGKSISTDSVGGVYTINLPVKPVTPVTPVNPVNPPVINPVNPVIPATPTQPAQPTQPIIPQNPEQPQQASLLSSIGSAFKGLWAMFAKLMEASLFFGIILLLLLILLILLIIYLIYLFFKKDDKKSADNNSVSEEKKP